MAATPAMDTADEAVPDRLVAYLIDFTLLSALAFVVWLVGFAVSIALLGASGSMDPNSGASAAASIGTMLVRAVVWLVIGGAVFGYFTLLDAGGQTFGKRFSDVVVATTDGGSPAKTATAIRTAVLLLPMPVMAGAYVLLGGLGFVLTVPLMIAWLAIEAAVLYVSDDHQRLGDRFAGTVVVETGSTAGTDAAAGAGDAAVADA